MSASSYRFPVPGRWFQHLAGRPRSGADEDATGLTNVTDLAFGKDGSLYVVQIADTGLLDPTATGSVVRIPAEGVGPPETVMVGLTTPYGIALAWSLGDVTTCSTCAGDGECSGPSRRRPQRLADVGLGCVAGRYS